MRKIYCPTIVCVAFILFCSVCNGESRQDMPLRKAILGHWKEINSGKNRHHYYSFFRRVSVFTSFQKRGKKRVKGREIQNEAIWKVLSESDNTLKIETRSNFRDAGVKGIFTFEEEIKFSNDRKRINVTSVMTKGFDEGMVRTYEYVYVDDERFP